MFKAETKHLIVNQICSKKDLSNAFFHVRY